MLTASRIGKGLGCSFGGVFAKDRKKGILFGSCLLLSERQERGRNREKCKNKFEMEGLFTFIFSNRRINSTTDFPFYTKKNSFQILVGGSTLFSIRFSPWHVSTTLSHVNLIHQKIKYHHCPGREVCAVAYPRGTLQQQLLVQEHFVPVQTYHALK